MLKQNLTNLLSHPNAKAMVYIGLSASFVPIKQWVELPFYSLLGIGISGWGMSIFDSWLPSRARPIIRGSCLLAAGVGVGLTLKDLATVPLDLSPPAASASILLQAKSVTPSTDMFRFNSTGFHLFFDETIPRVMVDALTPEALRVAIGDNLPPEMITPLIAGVESVNYEGVFFHGKKSGLMLIHVPEYDPDKIASVDVSGLWLI